MEEKGVLKGRGEPSPTHKEFDPKQDLHLKGSDEVAPLTETQHDVEAAGPTHLDKPSVDGQHQTDAPSPTRDTPSAPPLVAKRVESSSFPKRRINRKRRNKRRLNKKRRTEASYIVILKGLKGKLPEAAEMNTVADPSALVPQHLLPHMHLVSKNRFPALMQISLDTVVDYLLQAPKIVRDLQPMHWMMLDGPQDGSLMLAWQPLNQLGTHFASDGYVWADAENAYNTESRGYGVEMWIHKAGYRPPHETVATHCRKRYRLTTCKVQNPNISPPDPALWIVHYSKAAPQDHIRATSITIPPQLQHHLAQRRWIQQQGQVIRKEFMLSDRPNWPTINVPNAQAPQGFAPNPYQQNVMGMPRQGYPPQASVPVAGSRRSQPGLGHNRIPSLQGQPAHDPIEEEEDISRGDLFDFLTPRDISKHRYRQMTEWMEEIWTTPFSVGQIVPVSLGLGRTGELASLTQGFFDLPPGDYDKDQENSNNAHPRVGNLEEGRQAEFEELANKKFAAMRAQIAKSKKRHERQMADLESTKFWKEAELRLRDAVFPESDPANPYPEPWNVKTSDLSEEARAKLNGKQTVGDVNADVAARTGKKIVRHHDFDVVKKGGLIEPSNGPNAGLGKDKVDHAEDDFDMAMNFNNGTMMDTDMDMGNSAGSLLDQFKTSNTTTPAPLLGTPMSNGHDYAQTNQSASNTPVPPSLEQSRPGSIGGDGAADEPVEAEDAVPQVSDMDVDVEMAGIPNEPVEATASGAEAGADASPGGWVMVPNDANSGSQEADVAHDTLIDHSTADILHSESADITPGIFGDTPGSGLHGLTPAEHDLTPAEHSLTPADNGSVVDHAATNNPSLEHHDDTSSFPAVTDFDNIDTIGDELEGYTEQNQELDLADLDNSAFGDAFHASDGEGMDGGEGSGLGEEHERGHDIA